MTSDSIEITVSESNIKEGLRRRCTHCPIALATLECMAIPYKGYVGAGALFLSVYDQNHKLYKRYNLPAVAQQFISDFDNDRPVSPITFTLDTYAK